MKQRVHDGAIGEENELLGGAPVCVAEPAATAEYDVSGMDAGPQPLDQLMERHGWNNHALVLQSAMALTHKVVQKARRGRKITRRAQQKILAAVNAVAGEKENYRLEDLFNYRGR
jgi:hypothetical protein